MPDEATPISALLRAGGIFHDVDAPDKTSALRVLVARIPLKPDQNREALLSALEARESMGSTGIGDGIAIPHARSPIVLHAEKPFVVLCLLKHPIDFAATDGRPVHALFMVLSPTPSAHLRILGQLGFLFRDDTLRVLLKDRASAAAILGRVEALEASAPGRREP